MLCIVVLFCFKQKTAYEMRISDWSSDVCSSDLRRHQSRQLAADRQHHRLDLLLHDALDLVFQAPAQRIEEDAEEVAADRVERGVGSFLAGLDAGETGRASGRDRRCQSV